MDGSFSFLGTLRANSLHEILARRNRALFERLRQSASVSRSDADEIMSAISGEITDNLDDDWEPNEQGLAASAILAQFNVARLSEWP